MATAKKKPLARLGDRLREMFKSPKQRDFERGLSQADTKPNQPGIQLPEAVAAPDSIQPGATRSPEAHGRAPSNTGGGKRLAPGVDPSERFGSAADPDKPIVTPDIPGLTDDAMKDIRNEARLETERANESLDETKAGVEDRAQQTEQDIGAGINQTRNDMASVVDMADRAREQVEGLPDRVKADIEGIKNDYITQTNVDIDRIEGLGREASDAALAGKNAAAQAAVEAQQNSTRQAIAQINADPNIPPSRKTALIAQVKSQSAMGIASTVGANIKDFTALHVGAMTSTMNAVAGAMTSRNAVVGNLAGAQIGAISSAHETAAQIMQGYDTMKADAIKFSDQMTYNYNTLRQSARDMNDQTSLALLSEDARVGGMPLDFELMDYGMVRDAVQSHFAMELQSRGYTSMEEAMQDGDDWARMMTFSQTLSMLPGMAGVVGGFAPMIFGALRGGMGGGQ